MRNPEHLMRRGLRTNTVRWVRQALRAGVDPNGTQRDSEGERQRFLCIALLHPSDENVVPVVRALLDHGALVDEPSPRHTPALWWATYRRHWDAALLLVERGASLLADQPSAHHPWLCALDDGRVDLVRAMLTRGFDANAAPYRGQTAMLRLSWASTVDHRCTMAVSIKLELLNLLRGHGAQIDAKDPTSGQCPLSVVVRAGPGTFEPEVFEWFVHQGADLSVRLPHPLHRFHNTTSRHLLPGAKAEDYDERGWSLLHMAARTGHTTLIERLVALGVDPGWTTSNGRTALDVARHHERHASVVVLEQQALLRTLAGPAPSSVETSTTLETQAGRERRPRL